MTAGLVLVNGGKVATLDALRSSWLPSCLIGLYVNDLDVNQRTSLANVQPATFSGYDGLHSLPGWTPAALLGDVAISYGTPRLWTHNGGSVSNYVVGYYVVDSSGSTLLWAEPLPESILMAEAPNAVQVTPAYAVGSRYG